MSKTAKKAERSRKRTTPKRQQDQLFPPQVPKIPKRHSGNGLPPRSTPIPTHDGRLPRGAAATQAPPYSRRYKKPEGPVSWSLGAWSGLGPISMGAWCAGESGRCSLVWSSAVWSGPVSIRMLATQCVAELSVPFDSRGWGRSSQLLCNSPRPCQCPSPARSTLFLESWTLRKRQQTAAGT